MDYKNLKIEKKDDIAILYVDRPKALNALNSEVLDELYSAFSELEKDDSVRVIVLTGSGDKAFVAGADIAEMAPLNGVGGFKFAEKGHRLMNKIEHLEKPVIAMVNGYALGGGLEIAISCDFIYAAEDARVGFPEVTLGIHPGFGGTQRITKFVGKGLAKELVLTGKMITGKEAERIGLVNKAVPKENLMEEVMKVAKTIAKNAPLAVKFAKKLVNQSYSSPEDKALELEVKSFGVCFETKDQKGGMEAFLKKEKYPFKGE